MFGVDIEGIQKQVKLMDKKLDTILQNQEIITNNQHKLIEAISRRNQAEESNDE